MAKKVAYHGGEFFSAIGDDFSNLSRSRKIISADVLDAWYNPAPNVVKKLKKNLVFSIKTSPPNHSEGLVREIAKSRGIASGNVIIGGGSSDVIFTFLPKLIDRKDKVLILDPMYGEYSFFVENILGCKLLRHKLNKNSNFEVDINKLISQIKKEKPSVVILVNPNSPTGKHVDPKELIKLFDSVSKNIKFFIDETYVEYVGKRYSLEKESIKRSNLFVIKSMSKVYALSGIRVGYLVSNGKNIENLAKFSPPWAVSLPAQIAAIEALKAERYYLEKYKQTCRMRDRMISVLSRAGIKCYPSVANFFLIELEKGLVSKLVAKLKKKGIYLRNCDSMSSQFKDDFIRVAVKDPKSNAKIVREIINFV